MRNPLRRVHKNVIRKIALQHDKNKNGIDFLKKKRIDVPQSHNLKRYRTTVLLDHVSVTVAGNEGFHLIQEFYKMPTWAIPFVNVVVQAETEDGIAIEGFEDYANTDILFYHNYNYHWQPVGDEDHYNLYIDVYATLREKETTETGYSYVARPLYLNVYIIYINEQTSYEIQKQKT